MDKMNKWTPAVQLKRPDNIISSDYTNKKMTHYVPSYEKDEVNMFYLLAMEYGKIWLSERIVEEKQLMLSVDHDFIMRRCVIRGLLKRKKQAKDTPLFKMKRFNNVPSRIQLYPNAEIEKGPKGMKKSEIIDLAKTGKPADP